MRFDDTNPVKEDMEYVDSIKRDVIWLMSGPDDPPGARANALSRCTKQHLTFSAPLRPKSPLNTQTRCHGRVRCGTAAATSISFSPAPCTSSRRFESSEKGSLLAGMTESCTSSCLAACFSLFTRIPSLVPLVIKGQSVHRLLDGRGDARVPGHPDGARAQLPRPRARPVGRRERGAVPAHGGGRLRGRRGARAARQDRHGEPEHEPAGPGPVPVSAGAVRKLYLSETKPFIAPHLNTGCGKSTTR
jgi:hypothetical protein